MSTTDGPAGARRADGVGSEPRPASPAARARRGPAAVPERRRSAASSSVRSAAPRVDDEQAAARDGHASPRRRSARSRGRATGPRAAARPRSGKRSPSVVTPSTPLADGQQRDEVARLALDVELGRARRRCRCTRIGHGPVDDGHVAPVEAGRASSSRLAMRAPTRARPGRRGSSISVAPRRTRLEHGQLGVALVLRGYAAPRCPAARAASSSPAVSESPSPTTRSGVMPAASAARRRRRPR